MSGLEIRDWLLRFTGAEISNLDAISLSNCPKLSGNPRIKTVEYTVESKVGTYLHTGGSEKIAHSRSVSNRVFCLVRKVARLYPKNKNTT